MKKYNVSVLETIGYTIDVIAENKEEAEEKAEKLHKKSGNKQCKELLETEFIADDFNCDEITQ